MGFLEDDESISGTTKVPLYGDYFVQVRNCLSREEMEKAERLLMGSTIVRDGSKDGSRRAERSTDTSAYRTFLVTASIVDWNLTEGDGRPWQLNNDAAKARNVRRIPDKYFQKIWKVVDDLNEPASDEAQADFREEGDLGDQEQPAGAGGAEQVRAGAPDLDRSWPESGAVLAPPVA